jgi:hypothetical protein
MGKIKARDELALRRSGGSGRRVVTAKKNEHREGG